MTFTKKPLWHNNGCPIRFTYQMMLLSFNSNTRVDTSGAGTDYHFVSPAFIHSFYCHQRCPISSFLCNVLLINVCLFVRFLLVIVLSDYLFGIFKHFLQSLYCLTTYLVSSNNSCSHCIVWLTYLVSSNISCSHCIVWLPIWYLQTILAVIVLSD